METYGTFEHVDGYFLGNGFTLLEIMVMRFFFISSAIPHLPRPEDLFLPLPTELDYWA